MTGNGNHMIQENFVRFTSPNTLQKESLCYSDGMGFEEKPSFYIKRNSFNNYLIMYTICGRIWCYENDKKIAVNPGECVLMDLHESHLYHFEKDNPSKIAWVHINGHPSSKIISYIKTISTLPVKLKKSSIFQSILELFEISNQPDPDIFKQSQLCYSLILEFLKEEYNCHKNIKENPKQKDFKRKTWHYISHNIHKDITLDELAEHVSLSKYYFIHTFETAFGMTPIQFITEERIRQAKYQLLNTKEPIYKIHYNDKS